MTRLFFSRLRPLLLTVVFLLVQATTVRAVEIYTALLPVESRSGSELASTRRAALLEVVIKASGDAQAGQRAAVRSALDRAGDYLLGYSYRQLDEGALALRFEFDENAVQALLRTAGLPLWTANRPEVIAWLVMSDGQRRYFVSAAQSPREHAALRESFLRRGVPLQVPLYDLADSAQVSPGAAWRQSSSELLQASERYRGALVLAGRGARLSDGQWLGDWRFFDQGRWVTRSVSAASLREFTDAGADLVAATLAQRYAVLLQDQGDRRYLLSFRGVRSFADFRALRGGLEQLETVTRVVPETLLGDSLRLRVESEAELAQLARIIELDGRFVPTPTPPGESGLHYEWIP